MSIVQEHGMTIIKGNFGECWICDYQQGLARLQSEHRKFDVMITDPPYNVNARIQMGKGFKHKRKNIECYDDQKTPQSHTEFSQTWLTNALSITDNLIFTDAKKNLKMWYNMIDITDIIAWYQPNQVSFGIASFYTKWTPIYCYFKHDKQILKFDTFFEDELHVESEEDTIFDGQAIVQYVYNGFLNNQKLFHPHPKPEGLYVQILKLFRKPIQSAIDWFCGSGISLKVFEEYGIPYIGMDYKPIYRHDIQISIKEGIKAYQIRQNQNKRKQQNFENLLKKV